MDDHPLVREWLANLINQEPDLMVCGSADAVEAAIQGMDQSKPDLVIVDLSLKNSSGLDLIKDIRQAFPDTLAVVLSMHEEVMYAERALRTGAKGYVMKREDSSRIILAIRKVLAGELYLNESLALALAESLVKGSETGSKSAISDLSEREQEIFNLLGQRISTTQIAAQLNLSLKTVQSYCARMKDKLELSNSTELLHEAVSWFESNKRIDRYKATKAS